MRTCMVARYSSPWLTSGLWLNRIQETSPHCSLIPISSFLFCLKLVTILNWLNSFPRFYSLYTPWERGWHRTVSVSLGFAMPNDSWGSWVPACRTGTIIFSRVFSNERSTKRAWSARHAPRVKACATPLCLSLLAPRTRKSVPHLLPANLSVIEHHNLTVQHQREHSG